MTAMPPPLFSARGQFMIEKFGGTREFWTWEGESDLSQVSDKVKISILLSKVNSWSKLGLSILAVEVKADLILKFEKLSVDGPGFDSISPESSRRIRRKVKSLKFLAKRWRRQKLKLKPNPKADDCRLSKHWQTLEGTMQGLGLKGLNLSGSENWDSG